jgi:hypothetical protein
MDTLDKISIVAIIIFVASLTVLGMDYNSEAENELQLKDKTPRSSSGISEIPSEQITFLKTLIANNNINKAETVAGDMLKKFPYDGVSHMMMGDIMIRKQDPVAAMLAFREAVDLDPDYVDKKTGSFQGRKIKNTIEEAKVIITEKLLSSPGGKDMKKAKKTMYYLLRKLAGSCG